MPTDGDDDYGAARYRKLAYLLVVPWAATVVLSYDYAGADLAVFLLLVGIVIVFVQLIFGLMAREAEEEIIEDFEKEERLGKSSPSKWVNPSANEREKG
jgi:hypothetical protein